MAILIEWVGNAKVDCDGKFTHIALVRNTTAPTINPGVGVAPLGDDILDISSRPDVLHNLGTVSQSVTITGRLRNPCTEGVFALNIGGHVEGGTVTPNRVSAKLNGAPPVANEDGDFSYTLAVVCCGGGGAAAVVWELLHQQSPNVESSIPAPEAVNCPPAGPHMVFVTGKLDEPTVQGKDVYGLSTDNAIVCNVSTIIDPFIPPENIKDVRKQDKYA